MPSLSKQQKRQIEETLTLYSLFMEQFDVTRIML
jgi:hypothetical protein